MSDETTQPPSWADHIREENDAVELQHGADVGAAAAASASSVAPAPVQHDSKGHGVDFGELGSEVAKDGAIAAGAGVGLEAGVLGVGLLGALGGDAALTAGLEGAGALAAGAVIGGEVLLVAGAAAVVAGGAMLVYDALTDDDQPAPASPHQVAPGTEPPHTGIPYAPAPDDGSSYDEQNLSHE
ncbi:MAG TPA: hypothetical protein VE074_07320 [Jatrophihabitantaceae bacterium]|nr:hypothetical protein [Jatrophihabitantaceae bacterium]